MRFSALVIRRVPVIVVFLSLFAIASPARAGEVAVLPITTGSKALRIYRNAIPAALAAELSTRLGAKVKAAMSASEVPAQTRVLIDGRLVSLKGDKVQLDVHVRRSATGRTVATLSSDVAPITDIDRLVGQVATALIPAIEKARIAEPIRLPTTVVRGSAVRGAAVRNPAESAAAVAPAIAPKAQLLLVPASGEAAKGMVDVREPATQAAWHMLSRYGVVGAPSSLGTDATAVAIAEEMRVQKTPLSLVVRVVSVDFAFSTVLAAKGRVRVFLIGADGLPVVDTTVSTDTVVGSRGDRHQALVYRVAEQALDIAAPKLMRGIREASP